MKKSFENFMMEIDSIIDKQKSEIITAILSVSDKVSQIRFTADISENLLLKYDLNNDIAIHVNLTPEGGKVEYCYKGIPVEPECYYIRPDDYHKVSTLTILQECIKQDKHNPDIKYLERGELP